MKKPFMEPIIAVLTGTNRPQRKRSSILSFLPFPGPTSLSSLNSKVSQRAKLNMAFQKYMIDQHYLIQTINIHQRLVFTPGDHKVIRVLGKAVAFQNDLK